jgi:hypothetical protein
LEEFEVDIPVLSNFIEGLKLFFSSKRMRWLTLVFFIGAFLISIWEPLAIFIPALGPVALFSGGIFPTFFMLTAFLALLGLSRFVVSDESYSRSLIFTLIWMVLSLVVLAVILGLFPGVFVLVYIGVGFLGWIGFQSYFSTRNSLAYAQGASTESKSKIVGFLYGIIYLLNYVIIIASIIFTIIFINPSILGSPVVIVVVVLGAFLAMAFNFLNGWVLIAERNKSTSGSVALLGFFISFYSAYFIYNVLKGYNAGLDLVNIGISLFFILYTMSGIGRTLASRAELDTRWKLSKEFAATLTFFLASAFMFVDATFTVLITAAGGDPNFAGSIGDMVKLLIFPFVAFIMELNFIRKSRKKPKEPTKYDDIPIVPEEQEEEVSEVEPMFEPEPDVEPEDEEEETSVQEDFESYEEESDSDEDSVSEE